MAVIFHKWAIMAEKRQVPHDPLGLEDQFAFGRVRSGFKERTVDAVVGAVAVGKMFVGRR